MCLPKAIISFLQNVGTLMTDSRLSGSMLTRDLEEICGQVGRQHWIVVIEGLLSVSSLHSRSS